MTIDVLAVLPIEITAVAFSNKKLDYAITLKLNWGLKFWKVISAVFLIHILQLSSSPDHCNVQIDWKDLSTTPLAE